MASGEQDDELALRSGCRGRDLALERLEEPYLLREGAEPALPPILARELEAHYQASTYRAGADYVFAHPTRGSKLEHEWYAGEFRAALKAAGITEHVRPFHDARHAALTNMAATGASPIAVMATAGHRSMQTTKQYLHLAGVVFRDESAALEQRLLGVQDSGTNSPETALQSENP